MEPEDLFAVHVGYSALDPLYLPRWFVELMLAGRSALAAWVAVVLPATFFLARPAAGDPSGRRARAVGLGLASCAALLPLLLHEFPDEVFGNLIQARHLVEDGRYSFHPHENVDGSVDLLFYVLIAALGWLGCDLQLSALLLGAAACAATVQLLFAFTLRDSGDARVAWLAAALAVVTASLVSVAGAGWSSAFAGAIAAASIYLWYSPRWPWVFALTGAFSLLRYDFAFYTVTIGAALVACGVRLHDRPARRLLACYAASCLCPLAVVVFWLCYYGHLLPTPIVLKAGFGGSARALAEVSLGVAGQVVPPLVAAALGAPRLSRDTASLLAWIVPGLIHLGLVGWAGGDYMAHHRYHVVLIVALLFLGARGLTVAPAVLVARAPLRWLSPPARRWAALLGLPALVCALALWQGLPRKVLGSVPGEYSWWNVGPSAMAESRITNHTFTGRLFGVFAADHPEWTVASLEIASMFHFFPGISVDLQGFMNRAVALSPPARDRRAPWVRRCDPDFWRRDRPAIVWLDTIRLRAEVSEEGFLKVVDQHVRRFQRSDRRAAVRAFCAMNRHWWWNEPHFDSPDLLDGYVARMAVANPRYLVTYLVRNDVAAALDREVNAAGFTTTVQVRAGRR